MIHRWTQGMVDLLTQLVASGASNREIAQRLNVSRDSIIGKRSRLGLTQEIARWILDGEAPAPKPKPAPIPIAHNHRPGDRCITEGCRNLAVGSHGLCSIHNAQRLSAKPRERADMPQSRSDCALGKWAG